MNKKSISIIGLGNFGTLMASVLSKKFDVVVHHYKNTDEIKRKAKLAGVRLVSLDEAAQSDIVLLTVPISKTEEMIKTISKKMNPGAILMDACSVKVLPCQWLKEHSPKNIQIIGPNQVVPKPIPSIIILPPH